MLSEGNCVSQDIVCDNMPALFSRMLEGVFFFNLGLHFIIHSLFVFRPNFFKCISLFLHGWNRFNGLQFCNPVMRQWYHIQGHSSCQPNTLDILSKKRFRQFMDILRNLIIKVIGRTRLGCLTEYLGSTLSREPMRWPILTLLVWCVTVYFCLFSSWIPQLLL